MNKLLHLYSWLFPHQHELKSVTVPSIATGIPVTIEKRCRCGYSEKTEAGYQEVTFKMMLKYHDSFNP